MNHLLFFQETHWLNAQIKYQINFFFFLFVFVSVKLILINKIKKKIHRNSMFCFAMNSNIYSLG